MSTKVEVALPAGFEKACGPVRGLVKAVLAAERVSGQVSVAFVDEQEMAELNKQYRGLDESTDVLSFGQTSEAVQWPDHTKGKSVDLGEVVLCAAVVRRYSAEEGGDAQIQMGWTLLHGVLHLLGYDHEHDHGEMRAREQELLAGLARQIRAVSAALKG